MERMSFGFLRGMLGAFCVFFALFLGRSIIRFQKRREPQSKMLAWALRTFVTAAAVIFRVGFDRVTIVAYALAAASLAAGAYLEWRPKRDDDLHKVMFPPT